MAVFGGDHPDYLVLLRLTNLTCHSRHSMSVDLHCRFLDNLSSNTHRMNAMETYAKWLAGSNGTITQGGGRDLDAAIAKVNSCCDRLQPQAVEGAGTKGSLSDDQQRLLDLWRFTAMGNDTCRRWTK